MPKQIKLKGGRVDLPNAAASPYKFKTVIALTG
jgi:hypothetical protein